MTLLGFEIVLEDQVKNVAEGVGLAEDFIKDAVNGLPYGSIVCVGIALLLPLLKNPPAVETAQREGFEHVMSQMRYYIATTSLLL